MRPCRMISLSMKGMYSMFLDDRLMKGRGCEFGSDKLLQPRPLGSIREASLTALLCFTNLCLFSFSFRHTHTDKAYDLPNHKFCYSLSALQFDNQVCIVT